MKKEIKIQVYSDRSVGIDLGHDWDKPSKIMRKSLGKFLNTELKPFFGYMYTLKEGIELPKGFKLIREDVKPYGTMKEYQGILVYGKSAK